MRSLLLGLAFTGCAVSGSDVATESEPIIGGQIARQYSSAVLVDSDRGACSGAVIAPRVVLTAGHCVRGATRWNVTAPFAGTQRARSTRSWTKYTATSGAVNPRSIDVAVLVLDTPIVLEAYPTVASEPARPGTKVRNVGRVRNGVVSNDVLFVGREVTLERGLPSGYPNAYIADQLVESGDSGGPAFDGEGRIVAVSSGSGGGIEVLGRVDLVHEDLVRVIAESASATTDNRSP